MTHGYSLAGWRGSRIVVVATAIDGCFLRDTILSVDPAVGAWRSEATFDATPETYDGFAYESSTDGQSIAYPAISQIVVIDRAGRQHTFPRPAWAREDWDAYGLPALPGGGYLVIGTERLVRIAPDGTGMTTDRLPAGYVAVGPTSDPDQFVLAPIADAQVASGLAGTPFGAYVWDRVTGSLDLVATRIDQVRPSAKGLALLSLGARSLGIVRARTWWALAGDRSVHVIGRNIEGWSWLSPDGTLLLIVPVTGDTGPLSAAEAAAVEAVVRNTRTGTVVARIMGAPIVDAAWNGDRLAALTQTPFPEAPPPFICVVEDGRITRLPLP